MNQAQAGSEAKRDPNLNERLNRLSERMQQQCQRIEDVLCRVNGTPGNKPAGASLGAPTPINPLLPLVTVVEHLEAAQARLADLAASVERIA